MSNGGQHFATAVRNIDFYDSALPIRISYNVDIQHFVTSTVRDIDFYDSVLPNRISYNEFAFYSDSIFGS